MFKFKKMLGSLLLVSLFLVGCGSSSGIQPRNLKTPAGDTAMIQIGKGENVQYLTVSDLFGDLVEYYGQEDLFTAIQEATIKASQPVTDEIRDNVSQEISDWEDSIQEEANSSNVSYTSLKKEKLAAMGYEYTSEYRDELIYQQQKEKLEKTFWQLQTDINDKTTIDTKELSKLIADYVEEKRPYHLKHVLVGLDESSSSGLYDGTISVTEAKNLGTVCQRLATSSFSQVANDQRFNADYHDNFTKLSGQGVAGDVGLMATDTSFYNQFKFGTYLFDMYYKYFTTTDTDKRDALLAQMKDELFFKPTGLDASDSNELVGAFATDGVFDLSGGLGYIDLSECEYLTSTADKESWEKEDTENGFGLYREPRTKPRNVIFNQKFNNHDIGIITVGEKVTYNGVNSLDMPDLNPKRLIDIPAGLVASTPDLAQYKYSVSGASDSNLDVGSPKKMLADSNGNPIFYVRSQSGVHFMVIEKSPFDADALSYFANIPDLSEVDDYLKGDRKDIPYVFNGIETASIRRQYADAKKNLLIGQIQNLIRKEAVDAQASVNNGTNRYFDIALVEHYRVVNDVKFVNDDFAKLYENYIERVIEAQAYSLEESVASSLVTYIRLLQRQHEVSGADNQKLRYPMCVAFANITPNSPVASGNTSLINYSPKYGSCMYSLNSDLLIDAKVPEDVGKVDVRDKLPDGKSPANP